MLLSIQTDRLLMSWTDKPDAVTSSSSSVELDPLLKDLTERKLSFKKNVVAMAAELKDAKRRLALLEQSYARESRTRKVAETKAKSMEEEIGRLQIYLQEKDDKLKASMPTRLQYAVELDGLRSELNLTQGNAEASAASAQLAKSQCLDLLRELDEKNSLLEGHEIRVNKLGEHLDHLQKYLQSRELSQKQLREEVLQIEKEIMAAVESVGAKSDCELRKILAEVSPKNYENINKHLAAKDEEIARLRDEIRILSARWKQQNEELEEELEKHRRVNQESKQRVVKLEFCLKEARSQMRKLKKMGEKADKSIKELRGEMAGRQHNCATCNDKRDFWEGLGFKIVASMSMLVLFFAKR